MTLDMELDEVHVVSDLHIGGTAGFQIFASGRALTGLIQDLASRPADRRTALVINGDFVDFLAEPGAVYFDPQGATEKLDRLFRDPAFAPIWKSLRSFLSKPGRYLVVVLGNHDLELALPWVRRHLVEHLSGGKDSRGGRIVFALDGTGFRCSVAGASVLCLHGNEVDTWNIVDYERLRTVGRDCHFSLPARRWIPNSGTRLVIDVMNAIKRKYPFVDLLKPETEGVVPILFALDQNQAVKLSHIVSVASRWTWDKARRTTGFLCADDQDTENPPSPRQEETDRNLGFARLLGAALAIPADRLSTTGSADQLLAETEQRLRRGDDPLDLLQETDRAEKLGYFGAALNWIRGKDVSEILFEALSPLKDDPSFDIGHEDETFRRLDRYLGDHFDFVVAGHTHLERMIPRQKGDGYYFNCGTWARLIRLTPRVLASHASFLPVFDAIGEGSMAALDACPDLVVHKPAVVSIWNHAGKARAALCRVQPQPDGISLQTVAEV